MMGLCLDVSNYDLGTFDADALKAAGVTDVIIGCQVEAAGVEMAKRARAAGINIIATYCFLYFGLSVTEEAAKAIRVASLYNVPYVALDVESTGQNEGTGQTPETRCAQLREATAQVEAAGLRVIIYTGGWYWPSYMGNSNEWSRYPLWHSAYGPNSGPTDPIREVSYGGWTTVAIHQYTSTLEVAGRGRDANYILALEEDLDVNGLARLARLEAIVIGNGFDAICRPGTEDLFPPGTPVVPEGVDGPRIRLTGENAVEYANRRGFSLGLAVELVQGG